MERKKKLLETKVRSSASCKASMPFRRKNGIIVMGKEMNSYEKMKKESDRLVKILDIS